MSLSDAGRRRPDDMAGPMTWPRRSARLRLTALCGGLFLLSGTALLAATYALFERATAYTTPHLPKIPHTPAIKDLQLSLAQVLVQPTNARLRLAQGYSAKSVSAPLSQALPQLEHAQNQLARSLPHLPQQSPQLAQIRHQFSEVDNQLAQATHQFAQAARQLSEAVHQVAQAAPAEAAQRASDSHQLLVNSGLALAIVAVLALLAGWLVAGKMLQPIRTITRKARRISSTSLHERLALDNADDEFRQLGDTLDDLFARLEAAFEAQRHFVANASHELRTPITRERTLVQVALGDPSTPDIWRSTGQELLASNREQESLIEALLTLASSESGLDRKEGTNLADICRAVLARRGLDAEHLGLHVEAVLRSAPLDGGPRLVERLVANLVDNAIGHNVAVARSGSRPSSRRARPFYR